MSNLRRNNETETTHDDDVQNDSATNRNTNTTAMQIIIDFSSYIVKLLIMLFSPLSYYFTPLQSKCSPWHPVLKYLLPLMSDIKFHTHTELQAKL
jgi:hypothetical protein